MSAATREAGPWRSMSQHRIYQDINQSLVAALDLHDGDTVVDLGCGDGAVSQLLVDQHTDRLRIWAVDPDEAMLADARDRLGAHVGTCAATAETFGQLFPPRSCDVVVLANAVHLVADRQALYANVRRVLASGGQFAFNTTFYLSDELRRSSAYLMALGFQARSLARRRGFTVTPFTELPDRARLARSLPTVDEVVAELRAASLEVSHVEERPWLLDHGFMSSFLSARYEAAVLLPDIDMSDAGEIIREACQAVAATQPQPVPRPWLTVVARAGT